jgi:hypothetical protein
MIITIYINRKFKSLAHAESILIVPFRHCKPLKELRALL